MIDKMKSRVKYRLLEDEIRKVSSGNLIRRQKVNLNYHTTLFNLYISIKEIGKLDREEN